MAAQPCAAANPAIALWLQSTRLAGRVAELGSFGGLRLGTPRRLMSPNDNSAILRRVLEKEYGITGLSDQELQDVVRDKVAAMDPLELAAFKMRLGDEATIQSQPIHRYRSLAYLAIAVVAWLLWRPLAPVVVIMGLSNARRFAVQNALFWTPNAALVFGTAYGTILAVVVRIAQLVIVTSLAASVFFGVLGFMAAAYVGYGSRLPSDLGHERRSAASGAAVVAYLLTIAVWVAARKLLS